MNGFELIESEARSALDMARDFQVTCDEDYSRVGAFIVDCKRLVAKIKAEFSEPKRKADEAHKSITAMERRTLEPVQQAMDMAAAVAAPYLEEQNRLAKEEAARIERERLRKIEEERLIEAEALEALGRMEEAEAVIAAPIEIPRPTKFFSPVPKVDGLSSRGTWKFRILDPKKVNREFCQPDQGACTRKVQAFFTFVQNPSEKQKKALESEIGGGEAYFETSFAGRVR